MSAFFLVRRFAPPVVAQNVANDTFETYSNGASVSGLTGGFNGRFPLPVSWMGPYASRNYYTGGQDLDSFETYSNAVNVNALAAGAIWGGAFVARVVYTGLIDYDTFETYADSASVQGLAGGVLFGAAWET
jgi:hypothetical protein